MEWTTAISLAARTGYQGYNQRHTIQKYWVKAKAFLNIGRTQIVVTGHAGAGKTQLAAQMHGRARELAFEAEDRESTQVDVEAITPGKWSKLVRILPGHPGHRTRGEIEAFQENPDLEGVIHLVDYGFVAPRENISRQNLILDGYNSLEKLRERNLRAEVDSLNVLLSDVRRLKSEYGKPDWIVIAVNKVDLFQDRVDDALHHYHPQGKGEFGKALAGFESLIGSNNVKVHLLQTCAYQLDFEWNGDKAPSSLRPNHQNYILRNFMESVAMLSEVS